MEDRDHIKELFRDKLSGMESTVRPELWSGIASQIGTVAPAAAGISVIAKIAIGVGIAASVSLGAYFLVNDSEPVVQEKNQSVSTNQESTENQSEENLVEKKSETNVIIENTVVPSDVIVEMDENEVTEYNDLIETIESNKEGQLDRKELIKEDKIDVSSNVDENNATSTNKEDKTETNEGNDVLETFVDESIVGSEITLPNVFTPNGDGVHDLFFIESEGLTDFTLIVLDSRNNVVFQSNDPHFEWNGIGMNGEKVEAGTYIYYITARDSSGKAFNKYSKLNVITSR